MKNLWWNPRAIGLHLTLAVCLPTFFVLAYWQLHRALGGNELSWAYTFEWPFFGCYATWMWWKLLHDDTPDAGKRLAKPMTVKAMAAAKRFDPYEDGEDPELAAYNRYLASLHDADRQRR